MDVLRQIFSLQINMRYQISGFNGCLVSGHKILSFYIFRIVWNLKWPPIVVQKVWLFRLCVIYNCNISIHRHDKRVLKTPTASRENGNCYGKFLCLYLWYQHIYQRYCKVEAWVLFFLKQWYARDECKMQN